MLQCSLRSNTSALTVRLFQFYLCVTSSSRSVSYLVVKVRNIRVLTRLCHHLVPGLTVIPALHFIPRWLQPVVTRTKAKAVTEGTVICGFDFRFFHNRVVFLWRMHHYIAFLSTATRKTSGASFPYRRFSCFVSFHFRSSLVLASSAGCQGDGFLIVHHCECCNVHFDRTLQRWQFDCSSFTCALRVVVGRFRISSSRFGTSEFWHVYVTISFQGSPWFQRFISSLVDFNQ